MSPCVCGGAFVRGVVQQHRPLRLGPEPAVRRAGALIELDGAGLGCASYTVTVCIACGASVALYDMYSMHVRYTLISTGGAQQARQLPNQRLGRVGRLTHACGVPGHVVTHFTGENQRRQLIDQHTGPGNSVCVPRLVHVFFNRPWLNILIFPKGRGIPGPRALVEPGNPAGRKQSSASMGCRPNETARTMREGGGVLPKNTGRTSHVMPMFPSFTAAMARCTVDARSAF